MPTTNPPRGATRAGAIAALATLALGSAAHAGPQQFTRWLGPVSGSFLDPANWDTGALPTSAMPALIDAAGKPYTVTFTSQAGAFPFTIDSNDATVLFSVNNQSLNMFSSPLTVKRGELRLLSTTRSRDHSPITIEHQGRFSIEGFAGPSSRTVRLGRDLNLDGAGTIEGRITLNLAPDTQFNGFFTPRFNIGETGSLTLLGQNGVFGGITTNHGHIRVQNDASIVPPGTMPSFGRILGARIGENSGTTNPNWQTVLHNHGLVTVERSDLTLDSIGTHSGEFHIAQGARLVLSDTQAFLAGSRITGNGILLANNAELLTGAVSVERDLHITTGGVFAAALDIGDSIRFANTSSATPVEFLAPVRVGGIVAAGLRDLTFHSSFEGGLREIPNHGQSPRNATFHSTALIRGDLAPTERATFHSYATVEGNASRATFHADAVIQGNAHNVDINAGGSIGGSLTGDTNLRGRVHIGGNFTQASGDQSHFEGIFSSDLVRIDGNIDIRSGDFESRTIINAVGNFRATAGVYHSIFANTVSFDGVGGVGGGSIGLTRSSDIFSRTARAVIDRAEVSVASSNPNSPASVSFVNGFEIRYVPITPATRSGFVFTIHTETLNNDQILFGGDSMLAGTLDIRLSGDPSDLSLGDTFTLLRPRFLSNPTLTGEFDRLFLPTLTNGLSFDIVYDANAVRLIVVPTPAAAPILALASLAAARRRRA